MWKGDIKASKYPQRGNSFVISVVPGKSLLHISYYDFLLYKKVMSAEVIKELLNEL